MLFIMQMNYAHHIDLVFESLHSLHILGALGLQHERTLGEPLGMLHPRPQLRRPRLEATLAEEASGEVIMTCTTVEKRFPL